MKIILTQADFRTAIAAYLATQGMNPDSPVFDSMEIDLDNIEIDLNPDFPKETKDKPVQQRKRRTKAEIEAEEAKARINPVPETLEPVPTEALGSSKPEPVFAPSADILDEPEETLSSIVDTLVETASKPKREEPDSLFG